MFYGGKYFLFFCLSDGSEGVAESDNPAGPFQNARRITLNGEPITGIDPSVLEDGGRIYYTWGQFHLNMGELNEDLCSIKPQSLHTDVLSNAPGREGFHEGSSLRKLGDRYCLIYASEYTALPPNSGSRPTKLDYAVSDAPYGPYTRRGAVIDNEGCDPASWNNHGSVIQAGKQWYVFYHASSNHSAFSRRARAERLDVDQTAGVIRRAFPTTNGFIETLLPEHITSPVNACRFFGGAYVTETPDGRFPCVGLTDGAGFTFSPILFQPGIYTLTLCYRTKKPVSLRLLADEETIAEALLPARTSWTDFSLLFNAAHGAKPLTFRFAGPKTEKPCEIDSLQIKRKDS